METLLDERRLVSRVLRHWRELASGQLFPRLTDIDPWLVGDDWASCLLIRLDPGLRQWHFVVVGDSLLPAPGWEFAGRPIADCPHDTLLGKCLSYVPRVLSAQAPLTIGGTSIHLGEPILYRGVLMPLAEDHQHVDSIIAAANFRKVTPTDRPEPQIELEWSPLR